MFTKILNVRQHLLLLLELSLIKKYDLNWR